MNDSGELLPHIKLRFNIEHPSFAECYVDGYESALANMEEEDNPFHEGSQEYEQWLEGWWAGFYGEKPLLELTDDISSNEPAAANDKFYQRVNSLLSLNFLVNVLKITGAIAATAVVGYQVLELVA